MRIEELKLTSFSENELMFLYLTLDDNRKSLQDKIELIDSMEPSITRVELWAFYSAQLDYCTQWLTKVDEAQKSVRAREILMTEN